MASHILEPNDNGDILKTIQHLTVDYRHVTTDTRLEWTTIRHPRAADGILCATLEHGREANRHYRTARRQHTRAMELYSAAAGFGRAAVRHHAAILRQHTTDNRSH